MSGISDRLAGPRWNGVWCRAHGEGPKVLGKETGMHSDTVAKVLHEWARPGGNGTSPAIRSRPPEARSATTTCTRSGSTSPNTSPQPRLTSTPPTRWSDWANGREVAQDRLVEAVTTLHNIGKHQPDNGTRQLADVVHEWADQRGIQLTRPPVEHHRSMGIEIDL